jgi:prepilin signal peptidase PulO-like enzyme (type II secretory pathway)
MSLTFAQSDFPPLALGFFGLGTGYLIQGPQELFGYPKGDGRVDRASGVWGIWMPGFCQFVAGIILFVGLTWLEVFTKSPTLYMTALAFTVYGVHWFALGWNRYKDNDPRTNAGMCVAYAAISALGAVVTFKVADWPVGLVFLGLLVIYISDFFVVVGIRPAERVLGLFRLATGCWLIYLTYAVVLNFSLSYHWPL